MVQLSNRPQETTIVEAEAGKSLSFGVWLQDATGRPVDLTACSATLTAAHVDRNGGVTVVLNSTATIDDVVSGYFRFDIQADELVLRPHAYGLTVTLIADGYSLVLLKGELQIVANVGPVGPDYTVAQAPQSLVARLQESQSVHVELATMLPPNVLQTPPGGTTGQALVKRSDADFDLVWGTLEGGLTAAGQPANFVPMADGFDGWQWKQALVPLDLQNETVARIDADNEIVANEITRDAATRAFATGADAIVQAAAAADATTKANAAKTYSDTQDAAQTTALQAYTDARLATYGEVLSINADNTCTVRRDSGANALGVRSINGYLPFVGDRVVMVRDTVTGYTIVGRQALKTWRINPLISLTGHREYGTEWCFGQGFLTNDGIALLSGLIYLSSAAVAGSTLLFTLPPEMRPDIPATAYIMVQANFSDTANSVYVYGDGRVVLAVSVGAGTYLSLTGMRWPTAAAGLVWTDIAPQGTVGVPAFANGWVKLASGSSLNPRWAVDSYNFLWVQGMVTNTAASPTTNTPIITLTAALAPETQGHHICVGSGGIWGFVGWDNGASGHSALGINFKTGTNWGANGYLSLSGVVMPLATNAVSWKSPEVAGWAAYGSIFNPPAFGMRGQIAVTKGLVAGGTINTGMFMIDRSFRPKPLNGLANQDAGWLQNQPSADARGRVDITPNGQIVAKTGSSSWFTLDGLMWIPETGTT